MSDDFELDLDSIIERLLEGESTLEVEHPCLIVTYMYMYM